MITWEEILAAVTVSFGGRSAEARDALTACWAATAPEQGAQRCVIAHYLADQQDDLAEETAWDERALAAHGSVADADLAPIGVPSAHGFAPSLHLNLGDDYLRLGRLDDAAHHLDRARASADGLADEGYGAMIRAGIAGLQTRVAARRGTRGTAGDRSTTAHPPPVQ
ncbi:hypothetical protein [Tersicoccus sp. Bi-70]|uniref:hypothetical protein n=1 Tax=Tersicoccus sp. Bi-70 TaxID=1897634 RepID=UPI0009782B00|nr:hypothetical protein [Tersicoccus sp. Bi-70]OMH33110.1 hypothetical protein BGP79_06105 [Tersicoccus sp. Bi-70]